MEYRWASGFAELHVPASHRHRTAAVRRAFAPRRGHGEQRGTGRRPGAWPLARLTALLVLRYRAFLVEQGLVVVGLYEQYHADHRDR